MLDLLNRADYLKCRLLEFSNEKRFEKERNKAWLERFRSKDIAIHYQEEYINFIDYFILEWKLPRGGTVADVFIKKDKNITEEDKNIIIKWKKIISSIFQIKKTGKDTLVLFNLVNNKEYTVIVQPDLISRIKKGDFLLARIIPLNEYYMFSGGTNMIAEKYKLQVYQLVIDFLKRCPSAVFIDNEGDIEEAYLLQAEEYDDFIEFFGSDEIILSGKELEEKLKEFYHYRYFQKKEHKSKKTKAEQFLKKYGHLPTLPALNLPSRLLSTEEVGVIYDKKEGLNFFAWYGVFKAIFEVSDFEEIPGYKDLVMSYLTSPSISSLPFIRISQTHKENMENVFRVILNKENFSIPKDLDNILKKYKPNYHNAIPGIIPTKGKIRNFLQSQKIGRMQPCPCKSGRKYKDCCGQICH